MDIKVGLIGCGGISTTHISAVKALGYPRITAICDIVPSKLADRGDMAGVPQEKRYTDYKELLKDPEVDCVIIGTPHHEHARIAIDAARAGKHVLSEKPMATRVEDCTAMIAAAEESGVIMGVVFQHRFEPSAVKIKRALDSGLMGKPMVAIASVPWYRDQGYYDADPWKGTWAQEGGSSLINQSIHTLDRLVWFMGDPVSVTAEMAVLNHNIETEDVTSLTIVFANGGIGTLTATVNAWPSMPERLEIYGSRGSATVIGTDMARFDTMDPLPADFDGDVPDTEATADFTPGKACYGTSHVAQFQDFLSAVALGRQPLVTGREARKTLSVVCGAYESARTGKRVML